MGILYYALYKQSSIPDDTGAVLAYRSGFSSGYRFLAMSKSRPKPLQQSRQILAQCRLFPVSTSGADLRL
jgi:hypothetical protein